MLHIFHCVKYRPQDQNNNNNQYKKPIQVTNNSVGEAWQVITSFWPVDLSFNMDLYLLPLNF